MCRSSYSIWWPQLSHITPHHSRHTTAVTPQPLHHSRHITSVTPHDTTRGIHSTVQYSVRTRSGHRASSGEAGDDGVLVEDNDRDVSAALVGAD